VPVPRDLALLAGRSVLGGYLAAHGAQKLFGSFGGHGIDATATGFGRIGLRPAALMARVAALCELGGGTLTAAGAAYPLGPVTIAGTMAVAASTHLGNGPFASNRGYELPLTNLAAALALGVAGPGGISVDGATGVHLPRSLVRAAVAGAVVAGAATVAMVLRARPPALSPSEPSPAPHEGPQRDDEPAR